MTNSHSQQTNRFVRKKIEFVSKFAVVFLNAFSFVILDEIGFFEEGGIIYFILKRF